MRYLASVLAVTLLGCAAKAPPASCPLPPKESAAPPAETLDARKASCNELLDHLVNLATEAYCQENDVAPASAECKQAKPKIFLALRARGVVAHFANTCMLEMDRATIECELKGQTFEAVQACEKDDDEPAPAKADSSL